MSAKFSHLFADENSDLQKQIGCMTGIFQIFDRHHLITGRQSKGHGHKRLPPGHGHFNSCNPISEQNDCLQKIVLEKNPSKNLSEARRISTESSRNSFSSSSCSSSFSSLDCSKSTQEPLSFDRITVPERSSAVPPKLKSSTQESQDDMPNASVHSGQQPLDFRDVKDSINRDTRDLTVKTSMKEEVKTHAFKHRDSPRPVQLSKSMDGSYVVGFNGKSRMPAEIMESLRVMVKLKEAPRHFSELDEPLRSSERKDASFYQISRDTPRFSYDGRETSRTSLVSRENGRFGSELREPPRLSLDSRQGAVRNSSLESKLNSILNDSDRTLANQSFSSVGSNRQHELGAHSRHSTVVAKLMGLEAMPSLSSAAHEPMDMSKAFSKKVCVASSGKKSSDNSMKLSQDSKQNPSARSPKNSLRDPPTPRPRTPDPVMKPISSSRVPVETAPWRQQKKPGVPKKKEFGCREAPVKQQNESVYSEIEKRLKELEFHQCNKDLRALKQILDAMQAKGLLESKKGEDQHSEVPTEKNTRTRTNQNLRSAKSGNQAIAHSLHVLPKGNAVCRAFEPPIVIMKPAKSISKVVVSDTSAIPLEGLSGLRKLRTGEPSEQKKPPLDSKVAREHIRKNSLGLSIAEKAFIRGEENSLQRTPSRMSQGSSRPQQQPRESNGNSVKTASSLSPRLQHRKLEVEKNLRRPPVPSDLKKHQRQSSNRQPSESISPRGKLGRKLTQVLINDDQLSEASSETRNCSQQCDEISVCSDSNISLVSQVDIEATSADRSAEMSLASNQQGCRSQSGKAAHRAVSVLKQKQSSLNLNEDGSSLEIATAAPEHPSPISVLDAAFYQDDLLPSPVKIASNALQADSETQTLVSDTTQPKLLEINHKKLESIEILVQKLIQLSSTNGEAQTTDHIASLCETQKPDHRYVSEMLLASGLLMKDLASGPAGAMTIQLHPSGHPINPDLFLVLEQTKSGLLSKLESAHDSTRRPKSDPEKLHRKLMFDVVNEVLVHKLELTSTDPLSDLCIRARKLSGNVPCGQRLLKELCSEIDQLQAESLNHGDCDDGNLILGEDALRHSEGWEDFKRELPGLVVEIERSIFKDLIDEVLCGEAAIGLRSDPKLRAGPSRRRRQLFAE